MLPAVLLSAFAASSAQTIVIAALPAFATGLGVGATATTWTLTAFLLAGAAATPVFGRLGDLVGYRRALVACLGLLVAGTLLCVVGVVTGWFAALVAGRVVAGMSGGVFPLVFGLVRHGVPDARRSGVIALLSAMFGIGGATGMVVAGPLLDAFGAVWLFWPLVALGVVAMGLVARLPADDRVRGPGGVDPAGALLLAAALVGLLLGISQFRTWPAVVVAALFAGAVVLLRAFVVLEGRVRAPLLEPRLLRDPALAATNLVTFVITLALFGMVTLLPRFVQDELGRSATAAGLALAPMAVCMLLGTPLTAPLRARLGAGAPLRIGALCTVGSGVALIVAHDALWEIYLVSAWLGIGYGFVFAGVGNLVADAAAAGRIGAATAVNTVARTVGGAVGAQVAAAIVVRPADHPPAFGVFAAVAALTLVLPPTSRPRPRSPRARRPGRGARRTTGSRPGRG